MFYLWVNSNLILQVLGATNTAHSERGFFFPSLSHRGVSTTADTICLQELLRFKRLGHQVWVADFGVRRVVYG